MFCVKLFDWNWFWIIFDGIIDVVVNIRKRFMYNIRIFNMLFNSLFICFKIGINVNLCKKIVKKWMIN